MRNNVSLGRIIRFHFDRAAVGLRLQISPNHTQFDLTSIVEEASFPSPPVEAGGKRRKGPPKYFDMSCCVATVFAT